MQFAPTILLLPRPHKKLFQPTPRANAIRPYNNIIPPMVGAHRVRPKCPIDISTKLRCTQIIPILLPSTQKPEEPSISPMIELRDLRFDNVPFGRTQFAPTLWTKSVTVGAQSLRPPIDWDIIPTQVPKGGSNLKSIFNLIITSYLSTPQTPGN